MYTYIYINNDLLASSPPFNLNIVTSLSSATRPKTIKIAPVYKHLPRNNFEIIKMQNEKIQKKKLT